MVSGPEQMWVLPSDLTAAFRARRHLESACPELSVDALDIARLLVTELVSNAVLHAGGTVLLVIARDSGRVRVDVYDESPDLPTLMTAAEPMKEHGAGLKLVAALANDWGTDARSDGQPGKRVWFAV